MGGNGAFSSPRAPPTFPTDRPGVPFLLGAANGLSAPSIILDFECSAQHGRISSVCPALEQTLSVSHKDLSLSEYPGLLLNACRIRIMPRRYQILFGSFHPYFVACSFHAITSMDSNPIVKHKWILTRGLDT